MRTDRDGSLQSVQPRISSRHSIHPPRGYSVVRRFPSSNLTPTTKVVAYFSQSRWTLRGGVSVASLSPRYCTGGFTLSACPTHASQIQRADERTRTADLLITSWLVAIPGRTTPYRYGAYRSRTLSRGGVAPPTVYRRVPARLQYDYSKRARSCFTTDSPFLRAPSRRHHLRLPRPAGCRAPLPARTGRRPPRKEHLLCRSSGIRL